LLNHKFFMFRNAIPTRSMWFIAGKTVNTVCWNQIIYKIFREPLKKRLF